MRKLMASISSLIVSSCVSQTVTKDYDACEQPDVSAEWVAQCRQRQLEARNAPGEQSEVRSRKCDENLILTSADKGLLRALGTTNCRYTHRIVLNLTLQCRNSSESETELRYLPGIPLRSKRVKWNLKGREGAGTTSQEGLLKIAFDLVTESERLPASPIEGGEKLRLEMNGQHIEVDQKQIELNTLYLPKHVCE